MTRSIRLAVLIGVASAVPAAPIVLAQVQKVAPGGATTAVKVEVKRVDAKKVEAKPAEVFVVKQAMPAGVQNMEPQVRQFTQQFRSAMRAEYYFIRSVCAPTPEQRTRIAREGEKALREASAAYAQAQMRPMRMVNGRWAYPDPRKMIEEAMAKAVKPILTPDQAARYQAESEKRAADRKKAAARNIVSKLDQDLILTPEQREKLDEAVVARWDDSWCQSLETLLYGDQYYPRLPDDVVTPHLDDKQKEIWHGARQNQNFFFGFVGNMLPNEDPAEDKELIDARLTAEKDLPPQPQNVIRGGMVVVPAPVARPAVPAAKAVPAKK